MGDGVWELNLQDQYECHAFLNLRFSCQLCGDELVTDDIAAEYPSWKWCKAAALRAKECGWYIRPPTTDGTYDFDGLLLELRESATRGLRGMRGQVRG